MTRAFGAASVLLAMVLLLFVVTRFLVRDTKADDRLPVEHRARARRGSPTLAWPRPCADARSCSDASGRAQARRGSDALRSKGRVRAGLPTRSTSGSPTCTSQGVQVVYTPDGDAQGRQDFANKAVRLRRDRRWLPGLRPVTGSRTPRRDAPTPTCRSPPAARRSRTRSRSTASRSRTCGSRVRRWPRSSPTRSPTGTTPRSRRTTTACALPSLPIIPVVQSEGSGSTAPAHRLLRHRVPAASGRPFAGQSGPTEYFPRQGDQIAQNGSTASMNYVSSSAGERLHRLRRVLVPAERRTTRSSRCSTARATSPCRRSTTSRSRSRQAQINMDKSSPNYLLQNLTNVYTDPDPRTYPSRRTST